MISKKEQETLYFWLETTIGLFIVFWLIGFFLLSIWYLKDKEFIEAGMFFTAFILMFIFLINLFW